MAGNGKTSQRSLARTAAFIIITEAAQQLELAFAFSETIYGGPSIPLDLNLDRFDDPPPGITINSAEPELAKPLSKEEIRRKKAAKNRQAALRAKSRVQLRPHSNSHQRRAQYSGHPR